LSDNISDKDKEDWIKFIKSNEKLHDKENFLKENKSSRTRSIDLHGYSLDEANKAIEIFVSKAFEENINKLIIVTGKGIHSKNEKDPFVSKDLGILKYSVPEFISQNKNLMKMINKIADAKIEDGGTGAFYIYLKKNKNL
tara:strand:+ start:369 stop:788 length:420 start_codon:yes stop_codon:yes gene_type:complete